MPADVVVAEPGRNNLVVGAIVLACGLALAAAAPVLAPARDEALFLAVIGGIATLSGTALVAYGMRTRIVATQVGLDSRTLAGRVSVKWQDVTDYRVHAGRHGQTAYIVASDRGNIRFGPEWLGAPALREAIRDRAAQARAHAWGQKGTRPEDDWPRVFAYPRDRWAGPAAVGSLLAIAAIFGPKLGSLIGQVGELGWGVGLLGIGLLCAVLATSLAAPLLLAIIAADAGLRRHETITADMQGIRFASAGRKVGASWEQVRRCARRPIGLRHAAAVVVETDNGDFDYSARLTDGAALSSIIRRYATGARFDWADPASEPLDAGALEAVDEVPGRMVFGYRTRATRALLWLFGAHVLGLALANALDRLGYVEPGSRPLWPALVGLAAFLWTWWRYRSARVCVDPNGLTQHTLMGRRFIAWDDIRAYRKVGADLFTFSVIEGDRSRIWFWLGVARPGALKAEIARRATRASGTWD